MVHLCHQVCLDRKPFITVLKLISIVLLAALIIAVIVKGTEFLTSQDYDQQKENIHQKLDQVKAGLKHLCRPCPWLLFQGDQSLFQRNCYFFSISKKNWMESVKACKYMGAQLVVIKSNEEQSFLQGISKKKGNFWMGLSYNNKESKWQWVDGSPLQGRTYWSAGEPKMRGNKDCAIRTDYGWNALPCSHESLWICMKPALPCPK
eukprot:XP_008767241.2 PREDICTED: CD209 antigen-like protein A [Rattus norvegicus]